MLSVKLSCFFNTSGLLPAFVLPISGKVCPVSTSISLPLLPITLGSILLSGHFELLIFFSCLFFTFVLYKHNSVLFTKNSPSTLCPSKATSGLSFFFYSPFYYYYSR